MPINYHLTESVKKFNRIWRKWSNCNHCIPQWPPMHFLNHREWKIIMKYHRDQQYNYPFFLFQKQSSDWCFVATCRSWGKATHSAQHPSIPNASSIMAPPDNMGYLSSTRNDIVSQPKDLIAYSSNPSLFRQNVFTTSNTSQILNHYKALTIMTSAGLTKVLLAPPTAL